VAGALGGAVVVVVGPLGLGGKPLPDPLLHAASTPAAPAPASRPSARRRLTCALATFR
jgi:hypothetical protein